RAARFLSRAMAQNRSMNRLVCTATEWLGAPSILQERAFMSHVVRIPYFTLAPAVFNKLVDISDTLHAGAPGRRLVALVVLRGSPIKGRAYCMGVHWRDLMPHGADARELSTLSAGRGSPLFTDREPAALRVAETTTRIPPGDASDEQF